jgi:hypothetical protein
VKLHLAVIMLFYISLLAAKHTRETNDTLKKKGNGKTEKVIEQGLTYLSYLNLPDRTVDRMCAGIDDYKKHSGKVICINTRIRNGLFFRDIISP